MTEASVVAVGVDISSPAILAGLDFFFFFFLAPIPNTMVIDYCRYWFVSCLTVLAV